MRRRQNLSKTSIIVRLVMAAKDKPHASAHQGSQAAAQGVRRTEIAQAQAQAQAWTFHFDVVRAGFWGESIFS